MRKCLALVLAAMGLPASVASGAVRFSVGFPTTLAEVEEAAALLLQGVLKLIQS